MSIESEAPVVSEEQPAAETERKERAFERLAYFASVYAVIAAVLWVIQSATRGIIDPDGYYHIRWSRLLWENLPQGRLPDFVWLPLTTLNAEAYVDHHFLFHILQIPFTWFPDLVAGAKASAVVYGALAIFACFLLVAWERVPYQLVWLAVLLGCSGPFLFRMSLPRAPAVTVATLVLALFLLFTRRHLWYGVLSFLLVWMYSLFPLVGVLAGAWAVGVFVTERRIEWKPVVASAIGMAIGMFVNPYFPENFILFADHVAMKTAGEYEVSVGNEWYPYETWYLLTSSALAWAAQIAGWVWMRSSDRKHLARTICLFLFSTFLLVLTMKSRRFVEYWPPFAVLFCAYALKPHLEALSWRDLPDRVSRVIAAGVAILLLAGTGAAIVINVVGTRNSVADEWGPDAYAGGARWLAENTPEGAMVFNTDWDDFPMLFHHNTHNVYASGLDPTYLLHADAELSKLYEEITLGRVDDPGPLIRDRFGARWAFTDLGHQDFIRKATAEGGMKIVYEDEKVAVLEVIGGE
jgi:hypothetical protein